MVSIRYLLAGNTDNRLTKRRGASAGGGGRGGGGSIGGSSSSGRSSSGSSSGSGRSGSSSGSGSSSSGSNRGNPPPYSGSGPPPPYYGGSRSVPKSSPPGYSSSTGYAAAGGGYPRTIPAGTPFAGRTFGGGYRSNIYGGRGYGGGLGLPLAAGAAGGLAFGSVYGLGFPYGYWPLYYGHGYYGSGEYGPYSNSSRPGGALAVTSFTSPPSTGTENAPQYMLFGDTNSINDAWSAISSNCSAAAVYGQPPVAVSSNGTFDTAPNPAPFASSNTSATLLPALDPQNVLEFYRASSFALYAFFEGASETNPNATEGYTRPDGVDASATYFYPSSARNTTFEQCVNETIALALPIEEGTTEEDGASFAVRGAKVDVRGLTLVAALAAAVGGGMRWQFALLVVVAVLAASSQV
ncbi:hypothetical protein JCM6882_008401 [Rhodosporidiobolus microsporus]